MHYEQQIWRNQQINYAPTSSDTAEEIILSVYQSLKAKGHDPIMQLVGYIVSGDPTYITSYTTRGR